jgi:hydrogenase large subunit
MGNGASVVGNYVESLTMRRKAHTMSAILSGRHPIQNAIVPGGVTTVPTVSDIATFSDLLDTIRNFINTAYVPDVVSVANAFPAYWTHGTDPGNLLSYGEYPIQTGTNPESLLLQRGIGTAALSLSLTGPPTAFLGNVREFVDYSYYDYPALLAGTGLHPHSGITSANVSYVNDTTHYSWLKAPRMTASDTVCEVGPISRMVASYIAALLGGPNPVVSADAGSGNVTVTPLAGVVTGTYNLKGLVDTAFTLLAPNPGTAGLLSVLGRHACRALECKLIADAMAATNLPKATGEAWLTELTTNGITAPTYVYAKLPKKIALGSGWAEAPRGALGHWITIDKKRIANYQCVVPTTWNHSPMDGLNQRGAAESALVGDAISVADTDATIVDILRYLHAYDFCIACAVHMVRPDGSTIAKVKMDLDGKVTKLPNDAEI